MVKYTQETIKVLENFKDIFPSIRIPSSGKLEVLSSGSSLYAVYQCKEKMTGEENISIYDLPHFISVIKSLGGPNAEITVNGSTSCCIQNTTNNCEIDFFFSQESVISYPGKDKSSWNGYPLPEKEEVSFNLSEENMIQILNLISTLKIGVDTLSISYDKEKNKTSVSVYDSTSGSKNKGRVTLSENIKSEWSFNIDIPIENFNKLMRQNYSVKIFKKSLQSNEIMICSFYGQNTPIQYVSSTKPKTSWIK